MLESLLRSVAFSMRCTLTLAGHWVRQHSESALRPQRYRLHLLNAVSDGNPSHTFQQSFSCHPLRVSIAIRNLGGEVWIQHLISAMKEVEDGSFSRGAVKLGGTARVLFLELLQQPL